MGNNWLKASLGLLILMILYTTGLAFGQPRAAVSPSTEQAAWLNPQTVFHPDEFAYVGIAYRMLLRDEWNPHYFHNPTLNIYTNLALYRLSGAQSLPHDATLGDREIAPFPLYVMARYLSALYSLLAVALIYAAGRIAFGGREGLVAAGALGLSPLWVQHAHYATPNAQATLLMSGALLATTVILLDRIPARVPPWIVYAAGGGLVGLTIAARYNAAVIGLVTATAMLVDARRRGRWQPLAAGALAVPLGFFGGMPPALLVPREVIDQVRDILDWYRERGGGDGFTTEDGALSGLYYHGRYVVLMAAGPGSSLAALLGLVAVWRGRHRRERVWLVLALLAMLALYAAVALPGKRLQANLLFPPVLVVTLLAGVGIDWLWTHRRRAALALVAISLIWPAVVSILFVVRIASTDTRLRAQAWIYAHVPRQTSVYLLGPYNVPLDPLDYHVTQTFGGEARPEQLDPARLPGAVIVYSDSYPFVTLRDTRLASADAIARERAIAARLDAEWIELARFERWWWPGEKLSPDDVSYWHQAEIVVYCSPVACPVSVE